MRKSILHPQLEELKVTDEQRQKFDSWLAAELMDAKAARTASRSEVLSDLRDILGNCTSCHMSFRAVPAN